LQEVGTYAEMMKMNLNKQLVDLLIHDGYINLSKVLLLAKMFSSHPDPDPEPEYKEPYVDVAIVEYTYL